MPRPETAHASGSSVPTDGLAGKVRRGLVWSTLNSMVLRLGSLVVGMALARLLVPDDFGVFAVALAVQAVLMTLADPGMSVDLVRAPDPERRAPTAATLSLLSGVVLALAMTLTAKPIAVLMGAPDAAAVIMVLSITLVACSIGVVPFAKLQRDFDQRKLFICALVDFFVSTGVTVGLVLSGMGPMALAIGRVTAQSVATALQFILTRTCPRFGFDRTVARSALAFGVPLAGANLLSWALLNIDNVVIARSAGVAALGLYVLAFNISSWPMNTIGQAIRGVALAGFSHTSKRDNDNSLTSSLTLAWSVILPIGALLAALSHPLVVLLYGHRWSASAAVLAALGFFGAVRVALDLIATYLIAHGAARPVLYVQILWFFVLIPAVVVGARLGGITGAGWAHVVVAAGVILPAYALALSKVGTSARDLLRAMWKPALATIPVWWVAHTVAAAIDPPLLALVAGGTAGLVLYAVISHRWLLPLLPAHRLGRLPSFLTRRKPIVPEGAVAG